MTLSQFETCKTERISLITGTAFLYSSVLVAKKTRRCHRVAKLNLLWSDNHQALIKSVLMQNTWSLLLAEFTSDVVCHLKKRTKRMNPKHKETTIINENLDFWQLNVSKWNYTMLSNFSRNLRSNLNRLFGFKWRTNWHTVVKDANHSRGFDRITTVIQENLYE